MPLNQDPGGKKEESKDRRRRNSDTENDRKRSKFNLKLDKVSTSGNKTFSAAGASLKWLFSRKKSKLKQTVPPDGISFVNPIPIVAASRRGKNNQSKEEEEVEEEMGEKFDFEDPNEIEDTNEPQYATVFKSKQTQQENQNPHPHPQQRGLSTPNKSISQDRIAYEFNHDPHLHNFRLQGHQPCYPNKKLIFRPSSYPNNLNGPGRPPNPSYLSPRSGILAHIRGPFPPPRHSHPFQNQNHNHNPRQPPPPSQQRSPVGQPPRHNYPRPPYHSNFPNHNLNPGVARHAFSGNGISNCNHSHHHQNQHQQDNSHLHAPVPKQRKSLMNIPHQHQHHPTQNANHPNNNYSNDVTPWKTLQEEHKLPRVLVPIKELHQRQSVIEHMKTISGSTSSLSNNSSPNKSSGQSRVSSRNSVGNVPNSIPWFRWFASRLEKEGEKGRSGNNRNGSVKRPKSDDNKNTNCIRCNKRLPTSAKGLGSVINAPVACSVCSLKVCKSCAVLDQSKNSYSCGHCHPPKSIDKRKNFWFDNISPGSGTNFASAERDKATEDVREHLERIIESQVDEGIDSVSLSRLFDHTQYDVIFHRFHEELSDALMNLGFSLKLAIENKPMNETPTSAHTNLTEILTQVKEAAMELPVMEPLNNNKTEGSSALLQKNDPTIIVQPSYEDVLATAVINKAVINGQKLRRKVDSPMSLVDSAVQTDSEMSESSEVNNSRRNQYNVRGWVTNLDKSPPQQHPNLSDDDLSMGTSSSNWSNEGTGKGSHHQVVIEEQVEEITTTYESDSDISRHPPVRNRKGRKTARQRNNELVTSAPVSSTPDDTLLGVDLANFDSRVPFPEGGVDIVSRAVMDAEAQEDGDFDEDPTGVLVSQISEWEQNWLFKRRKQLLRRRNLMAESVPMLVPNPNDDGIEPQIGGEKISDLSDLSDQANEGDDDDDDPDVLLSSSDEEEQAVIEAVVRKNVEVEVALEPPAPKINESSISNRGSISSESGRRPSDPKIESKKNSISSETGSLISNASSKQHVKKAESKPKKVVEAIRVDRKPMDAEVAAGKTARFTCEVSESSPDFSVAWFFDGQLLTTKEGKTWIYSSGKTQHNLYLYDVNEKDSGKYHISLFDYKGNETKYTFNLAVTASQRSKPDPPNFTVLKNRVRASKNDTVITIPFELTGYPEPYLQVFRNEVEISKLSHVYLEDQGNGKWSLELRKKDTEFTVDGEYVAVAKNSQGTTRVTFMVQEKDGSSNVSAQLPVIEEPFTKTVAKKPIKTSNISNGHHQELRDKASPSPGPRPASVASEASSIGETMRETSHTLNRNQTLIKEDYEAELLDHTQNVDRTKMTVAEREKMKWANPVNLPNNPYAPENLAKRIRQKENGSFKLPPSVSGELSVTSSDDERSPIVERSQNLKKFARDYYVHGVTNAPSKLKAADGPNFGSSRSLSLTSNSSREGSNEKDSSPKSVHLKPVSTSLPSRSTSNQDISKVPLKSTEVNGGSVSKDFIPKKALSSEKVFNPPAIVEEPVSKREVPDVKLEVTLSDDNNVKRDTPSPRPRRHFSDVGKINVDRGDGADLKQIKLPSVRRLAQQFQVPEEKEKVSEVKITHGHLAKVFQKDTTKNYQQVHSLTARSVSKQFREGLKLAQPNTSDINIKLKKTQATTNLNNGTNNNVQIVDSNNTFSNNNNTLEINSSSNNYDDYCANGSRNIEVDTKPGELNGKKAGSSSNILARAAFWDKRVQEGIVDDDLVIKEFPKVDL